ncbi:MAG: hypothetical protein ACI9CE_001860 [Flavobacterium sp.]|jgi:hypothetical protein
MKWILRIFAGLIALLVLTVGGIFTAARFHDGPFEGNLAVVAGGAFETGEMQTGTDEPDWRFLKDYFTVEFQLLDPARSRTTFIMEQDGRIFIPSGYMNTTRGKLWKHWPIEAEQDGRAILRVDNKLYERKLVRVQEGEILVAVLAELSKKYAGGSPIPMEEVNSGNLWIFELQPRS